MFRRPSSNWLRPRTLLMEQLEDRLLLDAVPDAAALAEEAPVQAEHVPEQAQAAVDQAPVAASRELVLINSDVPDVELILQDLQAADPSRSFEVQFLDVNADGVSQITDILNQATGQYDAIHILSHGQAGQIKLGATWISQLTLPEHVGEIASWGNHLTADADILFYGCDVGANEAGRQLLEEISVVTGADVAASDDTTGSVNLGGDWDLEVQDGVINTLAVSPTGWEHELAQVVVNSAGGVNATGADGIKIRVIDNGQVIVTYKGLDQLYFPGATDANTALFNGIYVAVGSTLVGPAVSGTPVGPYGGINDRNWISQGQTTSGTGTTEDPFRVVTTMYGDINSSGGYNASTDVQLVLTLSYANPNSYFTYDVQVNPPTNGATVKYYHVLDTFLSGGDEGPAFSLPQNLAQTNNTTGNPSLVAVRKDPGGPNDSFVGFAEAQGSREFDFYYSAAWAGTPLYNGLDNGGNITNTWDTNPSTDNQLGIQFNLGTVSSAQNFSYHVAFGGKSTIDLDSDNSSGATGNSYRSDYQIGSGDTIAISDTDIQINNVVGDLNQATIQLTNPQSGDSLAVNLAGLPVGITVLSQTSSQIVLQGLATEAQYEIALQQIGFTTTSTLASGRTINVTTRNEINEVGFASAGTILVGNAPALNLDPSNASGGANDGNFVTTYSEGAAPVSVAASNSTVNDSGENDITRLSVTINGVLNPTSEVLHVGGTAIDLNANASLTNVRVAGVSSLFTVNYATGTGTIDITRTGGGLITAAEMQTVLRSLLYSNSSENPTAGVRSFSIVATDSTSFESTAVSSHVSVVPVNDVPAIDLNSGTTIQQRVINGDFSNGSTAWNVTGAWSVGGGQAAISLDSGTHELKQTSVPGWNSGAAPSGSSQLEMDVRWTHGFPAASSPASTIQVFIGGVVYAQIVSGPNGNNTGTVTYLNGASGNLSEITAATTSTLVIDLPTGMPASADLTVQYIGGGSGSDDFSLHNISVLSNVDAVSGVNFASTFTEDGPAVALTSGTAVVSDHGENDITLLNIVATGLADGAFEALTIGGQSITLNANATHSVTVGATTFTVNYLAGTGTFSIQNVAGPAVPMAASDLTTLVRSITYSNTDQDPSGSTRSFSFTTTDAGGATSAAALSNVTIVAVNDGPVAADNPVSVSENAVAAITGNVVTTDDGAGVDTDAENDVLNVTNVNGTTVAGATTITGTYGTLIVQPDGTYSYTVDGTNPTVNGLNVGQTLTETFTYTVTDLQDIASNGSLEGTAPGVDRNSHNAMLPPAWNLAGTPDVFNSSTNFNGYTWAPSPDGGDFLHGIGNGGYQEGFSQTLSGLTVGQEYVIRFSQSIASSGWGGSGNGHWRVVFGSESHDASSMTTPTLGVAHPWQTQELKFTATSASQTITFISVGDAPTNRVDLGIDGIEILTVATSPLVDTANLTITIHGANDPALVNLDPNNTSGGANNGSFETSFSESTGAVSIDASPLANSSTITDVDNSTLASLNLRVTGLVDGNREKLLIGGMVISLVSSSTQQVTVNGEQFDVDVTLSGTTATVTITPGGAPLSAAISDFRDVLRSIEYQNTSAEATHGDRVISITATDAGGTSSAAVTSTVHVLNQFTVPSSVTGPEDKVGGISLGIVNSIATSPFIISLSGAPTGTTLSAGTNLGGGLWSVPVASIGALKIISSVNYSGSFSVTVTNGLESESVAVTVTPVADTPILSTVDVVDNEDAVGVSLAGHISAVLADLDGSETLTLQITTVPPGYTLTDGTNTFTSPASGAVVTITSWNLGTLFLIPPADQSGEITLSLLATAREADGSTATNNDVITVTINPVNDPPVFTNLEPSITFTETQVNTSPQLIDINVTVSDIDSTNMNGGSLTVDYLAGGGTEDGLSIRNQGIGAGQIGFNGTSVTFGGVVIGTISGGQNGAAGSPLVIAWNANATPAAVEALIENLTYANSSDSPTASRTVRVTINDGGTENATASASTVIHVTPQNDLPLLDLSPTLPGTSFANTFTENGPAVSVASPSLVLTDADNTHLESAVIVLTNALPGDVLSFAASLPSGITSVVDIGVSGVVTITLTGHATVASYQSALASLQFENLSDTPPTTPRVVNILVNDGSGNSLTAVSTIQVVAVNDAPLIDDFDNVTFTESAVNGGPQLVDLSVTVTDPDSANLNGGSLTISYAALDPGSTDDQLSFMDQGVGSGLIGYSGTVVTFGGVVIGTVRTGNDGANGNNLIVDFTANATPGAVDALLQSLTYANADNTPAATRTIQVVLTDGNGGTSNITTSQITITTENDPPVLSASGTPTYTQDRPAVVLAPTVAITDTDDTTMESATVTISNIDRANDQLTLTAAAQSAATLAGITVTAYNPVTGSLTLSGSATPAVYQAVLAGVQFSSHSGTWTDRVISFMVNDGTAPSNAALVTVDYTADTIAPARPVITGISNDTGPSSTDGFTSDNTLTISGTAEPNSTLELFLDGVSLGTVLVGGDGVWTFDHTGTTLADGPYVLTATATDAADNMSELSNPLAVVVDTNTATGPGTGSLIQGPIVSAISLDSGASGADGVTSDTTLVIRGTAQPNSSIEVFLDGVSIGTVLANSSGVWSFDYTGTTLEDGTYDLTAVQTDPAGNIASSPIFQAVIDTDTPESPVVTAISDDTGSSSTDRFTSDNTLTFTGTAEPNSSVQVFLNGTLIGTVTASGTGVWSLDHTSHVLPDGSYVLTATSTDLAGNVSDSSSPFSFTVDTNTGTGTIAALPQISAMTTDTGVSSTDRVTSDNTLVFSGTGQPNSSLELFLGGVSLGTTSIDGAGVWRFDHTGTVLLDGNYSLTGVQTDLAGNVSAPTPVFAFTIDTAAPVVPTINTQITNDQTPLLTGTWDEAHSSQLRVSVNGVTYVLGTNPQLTTDGSGNWSLNLNGLPLLPEATYDVSVVSSDISGNSSSDVTTSEVTVDITPPVRPTVNVLVSNDVTPTITGTWAAGDATILQVVVNGYTYVRNINDPLGSDPQLTANPDGTWALNLDGEPALNPSRYNVSASSWDPANNRSNDVTTGEVTIDLTPPVAAVTPPNLTTPTDTGISSTDDLTYNTTPTFDGRGGEPGSTATIYAQLLDEEGAPHGPLVAIGTGIVRSTGRYTVPTNPLNPLTDGPYLITVTFTDPAGNESDSSPSLAIVVDTTAPLQLLISHTDTSTIEGDHVVNLAESPDVTIAGSGAEPTSQVSVAITDSLGTKLGPIAATVNSDGTWTIPDQSFSGLIDGPITVVATETENAGNVGPGVSTTLTLDRTPPIAPPSVDMTAETDSAGASNSDDLTNVQTPTFTAPAGTGVPGDVVSIYLDGELIATGIVDTDGSYEVTPTSPIAEGTHSVTASFTDPAGNEGPLSPILSIVIDITAPSLLAIDSPVMADDFSNADEAPVTVVSGTGVEPNSTVQVTFTDSQGHSVGPVAATVNLDGTWTISPTDISSLDDGPITISAVETDNTGNAGDPVTSQFILDTIAPEAAATPPNLIDTADSGTSNTDDLTKVTTPTFDAPAETGEQGSTVTLYVTPLDENGDPLGQPVAVGTAIVNPDGSYIVHVDPENSLEDGPYAVTVTFTDPAGNVGPQSPALSIVIDSTPPEAAVIPVNLTDETDTGSSSTDDLTSDMTPTFDAPAGTAEPGSTVTLYVDGEPVGTAIVQTDGSYEVTVDPGHSLVDGPHDVTVTFTDPAGNESAPSSPLSIIVDATQPVNLLITNADTSTIEGDQVVNLAESPDVTITGSGAEPTSTVSVIIIDSLGTERGPITATVNSDGTWTIPDQDFSGLAEGLITVVATEVDAAGNVGPGVSTTLTLDRTPPLAPPLVDMSDESDTGVSALDDLTRDTTPTFKAPPGTGVPGDTVTIYVDGEPVATGVVAEDGSYEVTPLSPLAEGPHNVTASMTDPAGNEGPESSILHIEIDTTAPDGLEIDGPITLDNVVNQSEQSLVPISGTGAEPGSTVVVTLTDRDGHELGPISATVQDDGTWSISPADVSSLGDGPITITATETDAAGNVGEPQTSTFTLDSTPPPAASTSPNLVKASDSGADDEDNLTNVTTPTFNGPAGSGEPGSTVTLYVDGEPVGTAIVNEDGSYEVTVDPESPLVDGLHDLTVTFTDLAGNEGQASPPLQITVDTTAPLELAISGPITSDHVVNAIEQSGVVIAGTGVEPTSTVTVTLTDSEGHEVGPVTAIVNDDGSWSIPPTDISSLGDGPIRVTAIETDRAGNVGEPVSISFDKDTTAPQAHIAPDLVDESDTGDSPTDNLTSDNTPTFSGPAGSGEPGSTVTLYVDGEPVGTAIVNEDGSYSVDVPSDSPLVDGEHQVTVTFTDLAGNEGLHSPPVTISLDTMPPVPPTTTQTLPDKLTGTGEPGTKITLLDKNGAPVVDVHGNPIVTTVGVDGKWTLTGMFPRLGFQDTVTVISTDGAGNASSASVRITFFAFDSMNNLSGNPSRFMSQDWSDSEILLSRLLLDLGSNPILSGASRPGTRLVARLYSVDGSILAEESVIADAAGNWMIQLPGMLPSDAPRIVIEHISTSQVPLGSSGFRLSEQTYSQLQFGTTYGYESRADGLLGTTAGAAIYGDHSENLNPLTWL